MTQITPSCPDRMVLADFLTGSLPESRIQTIESHLEVCDPCGDTIRGLDATETSNDLWNDMKQGFQLDMRESAEVNSIIAKLQVQDFPDRETPKTASGKSHAPDQIARASEVTSQLASSDRQNSPGRLGPYEITQLLGSGGTGVVYKAEDVQLKRTVALKVLRPSLGANAKSRFISEAQSAARIDHQHVITIFQVGQQDGLAYMAMQWLPGETLETRMRNQSTFTNQQATDIVRQIASGLQAAHQQDLIHRDIKPANIWIDKEHDRVKILDFGLARVADDDPQFTETGMIAGTPCFMSPEQSRGSAVDQRSDLFSLGCVLYRMVSGELPFQAPNVLATLQNIQRFSPAQPSELNPDVSQKLNALTMQLLQKNAAHRPQSANDLLEAIDSDIIPNIKRSSLATEQHSAKKPKAAFAGKRMAFGIAIATFFALLALGSWFYGQQIIHIATGKGTIEIETNDPNVQIEVLKDGQLVRVIDMRTEQEIVIEQGMYRLQATNDQNQISITPERLTLSRGGEMIVLVNVKSTPDSITNSNTKTPASNFDSATTLPPVDRSSLESVPVYDSRPLDYWLKLAYTERNPTRSDEIIGAFYALATTENAKPITNALVQMMRNLNSIQPKSHGYLVSIFNKLPPQDVEQICFEEIIGDNRRSRTAWLNIIRRVHSDSRMNQTIGSYQLLAKVFKNLDQHTQSKEESAEGNDNWSSTSLDDHEKYLAICQSLYKIVDRDPDLSHHKRTIVKYLQERMNLNISFDILEYAYILCDEAPETPGLAKKLAQILEHKSAVEYQLNATAEQLSKMNDEVRPALPLLAEFVSKSLDAKLTDPSSPLDFTEKQILEIVCKWEFGSELLLPKLKAVLANTDNKHHYANLESDIKAAIKVFAPGTTFGSSRSNLR